jgi:hypothetical protein
LLVATFFLGIPFLHRPWKQSRGNIGEHAFVLRNYKLLQLVSLQNMIWLGYSHTRLVVATIFQSKGFTQSQNQHTFTQIAQFTAATPICAGKRSNFSGNTAFRNEIQDDGWSSEALTPSFSPALAQQSAPLTAEQPTDHPSNQPSNQ